MTRFTRLQIAFVIQLILLLLVVYSINTVVRTDIHRLTIEKSRLLAEDAQSMLIQAEAMIAEANGPNQNNMNQLKVVHQELLRNTKSYTQTKTDIATIDQSISFLSTIVTPQESDDFTNLQEIHERVISAYRNVDQSMKKTEEIMDINNFFYKVTILNINSLRFQLQKLNDELATFNVTP